jgi:hypothetical protein
MNTKQLVVLWYAGLLVALVLLAFGFEPGARSPWPFVLSICVIAGLFILSFSPHPRANKKLLALFVLTPIALLAAGVGYAAYIENRQDAEREAAAQAAQPWIPLDSLSPAPSPSVKPKPAPPTIRPDQVELFDQTTELSSEGIGLIKGRIRNNSSATLDLVTLRVLVFDQDRQVDADDVLADFFLGLPPGEARSFKGLVAGLRLPPGYVVKVKVASVRVKGA